jgi:hypothetical protein
MLAFLSPVCRQRLVDLAPILPNVPSTRLVSLVCQHPELMVAPLENIISQLKRLQNITGLTGEPAVALLTPAALLARH